MHCAQWLFVAAVLLHEVTLRASARPMFYNGSGGKCVHAHFQSTRTFFAEEDTSDPAEKEILLDLWFAGEAARDEVI